MPSSMSICMPRSMQALEYLTAMGALAMKDLAISTALSSSSSGAYTALARPISLASWAPMVRAEKISSLALAMPTRRGRRWVPEKPGVMPRPTSGWPNLAPPLPSALGPAARMMSQLMASSQPPPRAKPFTAAMVGISSFSMRRIRALPRWPHLRPAATSMVLCSPMSAPATKERPSPVMMKAPSSVSFSTSPISCSSSEITVEFSAFSASGRLMVAMPMPSFFS